MKTITVENEKGEMIVLNGVTRYSKPYKTKVKGISKFKQPTIKVFFKNRQPYQITFFRSMTIAWEAYKLMKNEQISTLNYKAYFDPFIVPEDTIKRVLNIDENTILSYGIKENIRETITFYCMLDKEYTVIKKHRVLLQKYCISNMDYWKTLTKLYLDAHKNDHMHTASGDDGLL